MDVDSVPNSPGIYAWYQIAGIGEADWDKENDLRNLLIDFTRSKSNIEMNVLIKGIFNAEYEGHVSDNTTEYLTKILKGSGYGEGAGDEYGLDDISVYEKKRAPKLQLSMKINESRKILSNILNLATPIFSAPIYVGVAKKLGDRLKSHVNALDTYEEYRDYITKFLETEDQYYNEFDKILAQRLFKLNIMRDSLRIWTLDLNAMFPERDTLELREIAEGAEWLINRWNRPPLGRR